MDYVTRAVLAIPTPNVYVAARADGSPLKLEQAFQSKAQHLFIVGQNLHWLATTTEAKDGLRQFLQDRSRRVDVLICDPHFRCGVKAWTKVNPTSGDYNYKNHLRDAVRCFAQLQKDYIGRLTVRVAPLVPIEAWLVDPDTEHGLLVLTPLVNGGDKSSERPQIVLTRSTHQVAFDYYWTHLRELFRESGLSKPLPNRPPLNFETIREIATIVAAFIKALFLGGSK